VRSYPHNRLIPYLLFFSISVTSLLGFTQTLTGTHAESTIPMFYGLSFYTASLAYLASTQEKVSLAETWKISNPLLLFTGPIALFVTKISHKSFRKRFSYFFPFIVIGIFYFQIVGAPLTRYLYLIDRTDLVSSLIFAMIFELFVYSNFCGLSLLVYGIFGIAGYKIPLNFKQPFTSTNVLDFWKGWHTSLSAVLKKLFYTPLRSYLGWFGAIFAVYIASAMWHGVTLNFLIWGIFHASIYYISLIILRSKCIAKSFLTGILLIAAVVLGRLVFADSNISRLIEKLNFNFEGLHVFGDILDAPKTSILAIVIGLSLVSIEVFFRKNSYVQKRTYKYLRLPVSQFLLIGVFFLLAEDIGGGAYAVYGQR
jgi:alginate O-acetyltransferase complex protein AlgI